MEREAGLDAVLALARRAMQRDQRLDVWSDWRERQRAGRSGYRRSIGTTNPWSLAGRCEKPVTVELYGKEQYNLLGPRRPPMTVVMLVKCRRCGWCRKMRSLEWTERALAEYHHSSRTWMGTLTLDPSAMARALNMCRAGVIRSGKDLKPKYAKDGKPIYDVFPCPDYDRLPVEERFARLVRVIGVELTKFFKRIRSNTSAPFKYLLVAEAHKSGLPHFHVLIHEKSDTAPIRKSKLKGAWPLGFTKFALVESAGGAVYVCKYMAKDALCRMRASFKYGTIPINPNVVSL